jgi:hypothetical protein
MTWFLKSRSGTTSKNGPPSEYKSRSTLLTPAERSFFGVLQQALGSDYLIFAKVRLADILEPVKDPSRSAWQKAFNRITSKHVDFVLCDKMTTSFVGIIELDDKSHGTLESGFRDNLVDDALKTAGIPILRITAAHSYSAVQIGEQAGKIFRIVEKSGNIAK